MQVHKLGEVFVVRLEVGDQVLPTLTAWAEAYRISFAAVQAIGALRRARLGYFDPQTRAYSYIAVDEQVEVVALNGNVSRDEDGAPMVHVHAVLGRSDGSTLGGHLAEGEVDPTLEVVLTPLPGRVVRRRDPVSGLLLWDLS